MERLIHYDQKKASLKGEAFLENFIC